MEKILSTILWFCILTGINAQTDLIQLSNPSFEDLPGPGHPPLGWYFCGPVDETPPDVQPISAMQVTMPAYHGLSFAGLVVRDNGTYEALGQQLSPALKPGHCYRFRIHAARSPLFISISRSTLEPADFTQAVRLQLWAGDKHCAFQQLLAETPTITDTTWQAYELAFHAEAAYDQLFLVAKNDPSYGNSYNGHIMLDKASPLIPLDCTDGSFLTETIAAWDYPETGHDAAFLAFLNRQVARIRWVRNGFSLEQELLPGDTPGQAWQIGNGAIFTIARALQHRPDALLTVAVGPKKGPLVQHQMRLIAAELLAAGLRPERCLIRPLRAKDLRRTDWLNREGNILWGVSLKHN